MSDVWNFSVDLLLQALNLLISFSYLWLRGYLCLGLILLRKMDVLKRILRDLSARVIEFLPFVKLMNVSFIIVVKMILL